MAVILQNYCAIQLNVIGKWDFVIFEFDMRMDVMFYIAIAYSPFCRHITASKITIAVIISHLANVYSANAFTNITGQAQIAPKYLAQHFCLYFMFFVICMHIVLSNMTLGIFVKLIGSSKHNNLFQSWNASIHKHTAHSRYFGTHSIQYVKYFRKSNRKPIYSSKCLTRSWHESRRSQSHAYEKYGPVAPFTNIV